MICTNNQTTKLTTEKDTKYIQSMAQRNLLHQTLFRRSFKRHRNSNNSDDVIRIVCNVRTIVEANLILPISVDIISANVRYMYSAFIRTHNCLKIKIIRTLLLDDDGAIYRIINEPRFSKNGLSSLNKFNKLMTNFW